VEETPKKKRGFASWSKEKLAEASRKGGVAAHRSGTAHEFTREEASAAGRKGGMAAGRGRKSKVAPEGA
jgi:general stress protein YciG